MAFHPERDGPKGTAADNRSDKEELVRQGRSHAALVYDGRDCVGFCQFGATDEPPRKTSASFLRNATVALFERHGFERRRRLGMHH